MLIKIKDLMKKKIGQQPVPKSFFLITNRSSQGSSGHWI